MEVISFVEAYVRTTHTLDLFKPENGIPLQAVISALAERYAFQVAGLSESANLPIFQHGQLETRDGLSEIKGLEIQQAGVIAHCLKTDTAELFLADLMGFLRDTFQFRPNLHSRMIYTSTLVVELNMDADEVLGKWKALQAMLQTEFDAEGDGLTAMPLGARFTGCAGGRYLLDKLFLLETRVGTMSGANRYFSTAPFSNSKHVQILEAVERTFAKPPA